jgi:transcriptional regulator with XRE-family HTH domain
MPTSPRPAEYMPAAPRVSRGSDAVTGQTFGGRLKALREEKGLSQRELAERAGMNQFGVAKLEQGVREPTWATVQALARALGVRCTAFEGTADTPRRPAPKRRRRKGGG